MRSSNVQTRPLNAANADAKSILSELFITWASDPDVVAQLEKVIRLKLDEVSHSANKYIPNSRGSSGTNAPVGSNGEAPRGNSSNNRSAPYAAASSSSSSSSSATKPSANTGRSGSGATTPTNRYADPSDEMAVRAVSPAATPPGRGAVDSPPASARFLGVDEVDFSNKRAVSPGITPTSPHVKPVVDPTVPLPHSSVSPPGTHPLEAVELPTENSFSHESHTSRLVHSVTGRYATHPPANVQQASLMEIPVFYTATESEGILAASTEERTALLEALTENTYKYGDLKEIVRVLRLPYWWKDLLFDVIANSLGVPTTAEASISPHQIMQYFDKELSSLSRSRRMFHLIRGSGEEEFLTQADLKRMVKYLITSHPSLQFLVDSEFQDFYCRTVAIRMIYAMERQYSGHIHWRDFDRSNLPEVFREVDERDVNMVLEYFSYEHFYVLYCKFWELDTDRDSLVNYNDLCSYAQGSIVPAVIQRVVDGFGRPLSSNVPGCLNFEDFVYFCLSEEDKNSEAATLYWFRVLDTDGDGVLSGYELFQFYVENHQRILECLDPESGEFAYDDTMCQMMDMLGLQQNKKQVGITLGDLRGCTTASHFFNMIFNAPKFFMFEHREPFRDYDLRRGYERTDWDRYARAEYDRMSAESE